MKWHTEFNLVTLFCMLSLMAFGGGKAIVPEMHKATVQEHQWMSDAQFMDLFAISQNAPGPGTLIAGMIGYKAGGWVGLGLATLAMFLPAIIVCYAVSYLWDRIKDSPWRTVIADGIAPVTLGLMLATALIVGRGSVHHWLGAAIAVGTFVLLLKTNVNPLLIMAGAAVVGWFGAT